MHSYVKMLLVLQRETKSQGIPGGSLAVLENVAPAAAGSICLKRALRASRLAALAGFWLQSWHITRMDVLSARVFVALFWLIPRSGGDDP